VYVAFSENELRDLAENLMWLKAAEKGFESWNNPEDETYDVP